jgi:SAM-dependent methyltransferase
MSGASADARLMNAVDGVPERFVPAAMHGELVEAEHIARYRWATSFCPGRRVLDAGCGIGYGAELLHRAGASEVIGVDVSEPIVEIARSGVSGEVVFEVADVRSLPYAPDSFDMIVCFEVIEHVDEQDQVLDQLARVLRPDGLLLISSPNRSRYVPGNPHHRHEYIPEELRAALEIHFPSVKLIPQHVMLASVIDSPREPGFAKRHVEHLVSPQDDDEIYTLAMAGARLPAEPGPMVTLTQFLETRKWLEHFDAQKRYIDEQTEALQELEIARRERQEALNLLTEREQSLAELMATRGQLDEANAAALGLLQSQLDQLYSSHSWRLTKPLRALARFRRR